MSDLRKIYVELDWFANTNHTGFLLAQKKGYFKEEGLEVIIKGEVHGEIHENDTDILVSPEPALLTVMNEGWDITCVATLTQKSDSGIVSLKENGIVSPKHLMGHRLSHWAPEWFHACLKKAVEIDGGDYDKVILVQKDVGNIVETLETDIDATWVYENWENYELVHSGKEINYFNMGEVSPLFNFCAPAVAATRNMCDNRTEDLKGFLRALDRGYVEAALQPEESVLLCRDLLPAEVSPEMLIESQKHLSGYFLDGNGHWGYIDPERWNPFAEFMLEKGLIKKRFDREFTNEYLPY